MKNYQIKNCPCCDGKAEVIITDGDFYIACKRCGLHSESADSDNEFIVDSIVNDWNKRIVVERLGKENKELTENNKKLLGFFNWVKKQKGAKR